MPRLQVSGNRLSNHSKEAALSRSCVRRIGLRPLLSLLLPLLWGGALLHAQTTVLGPIRTFAGQCNSTGFAGDGGLATAAKLGNSLGGIAIDPAGNVFFADTQKNVIRMVDTSGIITTVAGVGGSGNGNAGDGGSATASAVKMSSPVGVAVNPATGVIYFADSGNNRVRAFTVGGTINTVLGGGNTATSPTPTAPTSLKTGRTSGLYFDAAQNALYIGENNNEILKWDLNTNLAAVVVGNYAGAGMVNLGGPLGVAVQDSTGAIYIAENGGAHILSRFQGGAYSVVAGAGTTVIPSNGTPIAPLSSSKLNSPSDVAFDTNGFLYLTDIKGGGNGQLYRIDLVNGSIQTVAGTGANGCTGDLGPALSATLQAADGLAITSNNRLYVGQDSVGVVRTMLATGPPASVTVVSGAPQTAIVGTTFNAPFVVVVMDAAGNPLSGITVNFAGGGEVVSPPSATTDINGQAQTSITASTIAGAFTVSASVTGVATPATGAFTNLPGAVTTIKFATEPTGTTAGTIITPAVAVQALDIYNNPVSGVTIVVSGQGGPGSLEGTLSAVTGAGGLATFSDLKLEATGTYTLQATDGVHFATSASFIISPAAGGTITVLAGDGQSARLTQQYASQLEVVVKDGIGNPIPNASVTFTAPATAATVTFTGSATVATNAAGVASVAVTAAGATGTLQVTASAAAAGIGGTAIFNLENLSGTAQQLHFVTQPSSASAGATITPSVTVQLQDSGGNSVATPNVLVTLSLVPSAPLGGTVTEPTDATGLATFSNLAVDTVGTYFLTATSPGLVSTQSTAFTISGGLPAKITVISGTPQSAIVLGPFAIPLRVLVADSFNNPISGVTVTFSAPAATGPSATLSSTSAITDSTGLASVSASADGFAGGPYTVTAMASGFTANFVLTNIAGAASSLVFTVQPVDTTAGAIMAPVTLKVTDAAGNPVSGELVALTAQGGLGVLSGMTPTTTDVNGLAKFTTLSINLTGTYSLQGNNGVRFATSSPFVVNPGTAASITVVAGSGESAPVGSFYPSPLRASVQDTNGNAVPGVSVTFTAPSSGASVTFTGSTTLVTDSTGVASVSVAANAVVGAFEVTAIAPGIPNPAVFQLENIPGTASQLRFVAQPLDTEAGATMADVTVQITDNVGNPIALPGVSVALTLNPVVGRLRSLSGMTVGITDGNGLADFSGLSISTAGLYQLTATATALASAQSGSFTIFAGLPATITATSGTPQSTTVLAPFAVPLQVIVTDSHNNPLSGQTVTFTAPTTGASANLTSSTATTDASGHASVTAVANGVTGSYSVTASVDSVSPSASFALTNMGGAGASLIFSVQPSNAAAGAIITPAVVVTVTDNGGNPVSGDVVSLSAQGGTGVLSGMTPTATDASGHATFSNLSIDQAGTYALQATDGTRFTTSNSFVIGPGTASSITVVAGSGQSAAVSTPYATALKASVQDAEGNGIPGVSVTFAAPTSGASVTFSGPATVNTDSTGVASISVTANAQVGSFDVTATTTGISTPAMFMLTNVAGTASHLAFVQQPTDTVAGAIVTPAVTVQLTDSLGNAIAQSGVTITLSLTAVAGRLRSASGTLAVTDATGLATFSALSISIAGTYQLTASGMSLVSTQSNTFHILTAPPAAIAEIAGTPQSTTVLGPFAVPLQVLVTDSFGNPLNGVMVAFAAPSSGASATLSAITATTGANGQASVTATANSTAGSYTVTASVAGLMSSASFELTNLGSTGSNLVFTTQPVNTAAGGIIPSVVVRVTDNGGNPVSGVTIALTAQGGAGTLSGAVPVVTDANGLATFANLSIDRTGIYSLQATDGTRFATSASFVIAPATSSSITVVAGNGQSAAVSTNYLTPLRVSVQDSLGNPIAGTEVTFAAPTSGASITFLGSPTVTTDASGVAGIFVTANAQVGPFDITATASGIATPAAFSLTNVPGTANKLSFVQQPQNTQVGAVMPSITVQLKDGLGNNVSQAGVAVTLSLNPTAGPLVAVSGTTTVMTDAAGLATFTGLSIITAGTYQFTAVANSLVSAESNPFTISAATAAVIQTVSGTPQSTTVLGPFAIPLQVRVTDSFGNPLSGVTVTFAAPSSGASATLSASTATTDTSGLASVTAVANGTQGSYSVTASVSGVSPSATFALTNLGGAGSNLIFTVQPVSTAAGAVIPPVAARVTDAGGNPVSGVTITVTAQGGPGVLSGAVPVVTDASGLAYFSNLSIDRAGTYFLQATDGTRFAGSAAFVITPATSSSITVVAGNGQSAPVTAPYATPLRVSVQDAQGNGVPNVAVTFAAPSSGASLTFTGSATVTTDSTGVASVSVTANAQVGSFQVTATASGIATPATFSLTNIPGAASRLSFAQQPQNTAAGATMPSITVQLTDSLGHNVAQAGVAVTLSLTPTAGPLVVVSGTVTVVTDSTGLATFTSLSIATAGTYQFTAVATSVASAESNLFTISTGAAAAVQTVAGTPQSATVLAPFAVPLQVRVTDLLGNPLSGVTVTFAEPSSGASASLSATTATTDLNGLASVTAVANGTVGSYAVTASVSGVSPSASFALTNLGGTGSNLAFTVQPVNTAAGAAMASVVVKVTDNGGNPVSGVTIALTAQGGPGVLSGAIPVMTDASGLATFSNLSIDKTGIYSLQATDGTRFATSASFVIAPATSSSITVVAGNGQSAAVTTNYLTPLRVSVQDSLGNPIAGAEVTFAAPGGASVTFLGPVTVTTDAAGIAGIFVTANAQVGALQVTATAVGIVTPAVFSLTNVPGTANRLSFVQQPSNTQVGAVISPPITVHLTDGLGNNVSQAGVAVTLSLNPTAGPLVAISGTTTVMTDAAGLATFTGLSIITAGTYQFTAVANSLVSAESQPFTISTGAAATIQTVTGTPQSTTILAPFPVPLQARVTDSFGNPLSGVTVTFAALSSGASATLSASTATTDTSGLASVTAVANGTQGSYSVNASVSGVSPSATFALTNLGGAGSNLIFTVQPVSTAAGAVIPPVAARVTDSGGNPVSGVTITVTAQGRPGVLSGAVPVATDANGLATFSNLSIDKAGTYFLQATDGTRFAGSAAFVITPATSSSITVVAGNGQSALVSGPYATPLRVRVQDAQGNGVPGVSVTFVAPSAGASVTFSGPATVTTGSSGVASISVTANAQVGSFQVTATASGIATSAMFSLTNIPGTASRLSFVQQPQNTGAGATMTPITVQLTDSSGHNVAQAGVAVTLSLNPTAGPLVTVSGTTTVQTDSTGLATFTGLRIATAGSYQFTALGTSLASVVSNSFTITTGAAAAIETVAGTPQSTTVLGPFAVPLQVLVADSLGNPLSGVTVTFAAPAAGASANLSTTTVTTDANGHASVSATANGVEGSYTVSATAAGVATPASFALTNLTGTGSNLTFTIQPVNTPAGALMTPVALKVTDNAGNPVSGVTIALTAQGGPGTLSGAAPVATDASGLATFSNLSIDKAGTYFLQATDGTRFAGSAAFVITPATSSSISVVAGNGQSALVSGPYATPLRVKVQDAQGNGVPGVAVTFAAPGSSASVSFTGPATVTTGSTGVASISVTANAQVGSFQVTATASGIATPATFSLTNIPGTASRLSFVQQPQNTGAGATMTPVTVHLTDSTGHNVAQAGVAVTLSLNPTAGPLVTVSGTTTVQTDSTGLATFSGLTIGTAGTYQFTAVATSIASAESSSFTIAAAAADVIQTVTGTPQSTAVLAPFAVPLQVLVADSFGNPLSGVTVTFAAPATGASATLSATSATTDTNGHASVSATANGTAGSYTVSAAVASVTTSASFALTNVAGTGSNLIFIQQPANTAAGATIPPVQVRATDNGGNPIGGVTISVTAQGGPGVLSGATPVVTNASGLATFSNLSINQIGTYSLQATDGTHFATSISFVITPGTASSITVVAGSGQSAAVGAPYATALKVSVQDVHGNGVPGISVAFSAPPSGASVTFSGSTTVSTDSSGVASISATANTQVGSFQVMAGAVGIATAAVFTLTNVAGTASHLSFVQQPTATVAGAIVSPAVTVQLTDSAGNPIAQSGVTITLSLNPVAGRLRSISGTVATTNASGLATFSALSTSSAGAYQLTASGASLVSAQSTQFVVSAGPASAIQAISGTPQSTTALAPFAVPLQVLVTDSFANPIAGVTVAFTAPASGASATLSPTAATTDASGHASVTATANSVVGAYTVTASAAGVTPAASFALTNVSSGGALLSFTQQPANTPAGATLSPVTLKFADSAGNPVSGASVTLALTGGTGSLIGTLTATTDATGTAAFSALHIDVSGSYQLVASTGGISALSSVFQIGPAAGRTITVVSGNTQAAAAGDAYAVPLTVSVQDGLGNAVSGAQVTFTPPTAGASVTFGGSATVTSGANGLASSPIASANSQPGVFQVSATTPGATGQATFNLQNLSATATKMQFVQQPSDTTAGASITPAVAVQLVDRFGNQVAQAGVGIQVFLISTTTVSAGITGATAPTISSGLATFPNLSIAQAGTYQLLALATGFESSVSATFHVSGGAPAGVTTASGTPQSTTVLTTFAQPFVALVTDSAGNPLPGTTVTFTAPTSGATGTFTGNTTTVTATTDANGRATSSIFTANHTSGTYAVTASVTAVGRTATFSLANLQPAALTLAFLTQPSNAASGAVISPPVRVQIEDSNGQPVSQSGVTVLVTLSQGTGSLFGTHVQMTDANGIATFSDLSIDLAGPKRLQAFGSAEAAVVSNQFQISAGAPSQLVPVTGSAQIAAPLGQFSGPLQVVVQDAAGNPVPGVAVTFSLPASGSSGTFAGPAVVQSGADGVATSPPITANGIQGVFNAMASAANVANAQFPLAIIQPSSGFLQVTPATMQFVQTFGGTAPDPQNATIVSTSDSQLTWTATSTAPWLSVSPASGTTPAQITLTASGAGLAPGQYGALVTIVDTNGDQQTIFVIFTVGGAATLVVRPPALAFVAVVGANQLPNAVSPQQIRVTSTNALAPISFKITAQVETPTTATWLTVLQASGATPGTITGSVDTTALQPGVYSGVVILTPDDPSINPVSVTVTLVVGCGSSGCPSPAPAGQAVTNAASFHLGGSPGGAQTIFGSYLASSTQTAATFPLPTSLAGTSVLVNGIAAPLYYVSPNQINFQMPSATAPGSPPIVVTTSAGTSPAVTPLVTSVQPGLFIDPSLRAKALNQDLTLNTPQNPIGAGQYILLYLTGMGPTTPSVADGQPAPTNPLAVLNGSVSATIGGVPATVQFAGLAPGFAGLIQVNVQVPSGLSPGNQPVFITINGSPSNAGLITVK